MASELSIRSQVESTVDNTSIPVATVTTSQKRIDIR